MAKYLDDNGLLYFWQKLKNTFAQKSSLATVATSGSYNDLTDRPTIPEGADLTGYATETWVTGQITSSLADKTGIKFSIVTELPSTGESSTIYLVSNGATGSNVYTEWVYVNSAWETLGSTQADLSGYLKSADVSAITNTEIDTTMATE